ncbi:MAG: ester cyclase [Chloroflexi bacterium]|nr:ester cyclase [Chloroflexota bacterium]
MDPAQFVRDEIEDLSRGDLQAVLDYYTDDVFFHDVSAEPCHGKEEMREFMAVFYRGFPDLRIEISNVIAQGSLVVAEYDLLGTHTGTFLEHASTGRAFRIPAVSIYEHNGMLFTRETVYYDSAALFGQLGLPLTAAI